MIPILIVGSGGHCNSLIEIIECQKTFEIKGIISKELPIGSNINGIPVVGKDMDLPKFNNLGYSFAIGIGQIKSNAIRKLIYSKLFFLNASIPNIISPFAHISSRAKIGSGNSIFHNVIINSYAQIGDNCILNSKSLIEHDSEIGSHNHISTGALINGNVKIGDNCFIGSGTIIANGVEIVSNSIIGAGSVVIRDIEIPGTYWGNPAKLHK